jgi:hypothetical protein
MLNVPRLSKMLLRDILGVALSYTARTDFEDYYNLGLVYFANR